MRAQLESLKPWRKGPFDIEGIHIDAEWDCAIKWQRVKQDLAGKTVLDIGCNNGYFMFRMREAGASRVVGIDPVEKFHAQFQLVSKYLGSNRMEFHHMGWQDLPNLNQQFDVVFCMGIIYHHPAPLDLLKTVRSMMNPGGDLIIETIVHPGEDEVAFFPQKKYAGMNNVFFVPTIPCLKNWLIRSGFVNLELLYQAKTTPDEQRVTEWSAPVSLADFVKSSNDWPVRAALKASKREGV